MKAPQNTIFIKVDAEHNDEIQTKSGTKLYLSTTPYHEEDGAKLNDYAIKRHYGTVVGEPGSLTNLSQVRPVHPGSPAPGRYNSSEDIELMLSRNITVDSWASLNTFVHEWKTCADFEQEVQAGDKIYFHFNTVSDNNLVQYVEEKIYKLGYSSAICVVREIKEDDTLDYSLKTIVPIAGHVLIEPKWEDGVEDLGEGKRGKLTDSGLVKELHDKPKYLEGIVRYVGKPMKGDDTGVKSGDIIIYAPHADWTVEIEGVKYYVMRYWDIEAKIEDEEALEIPSPSGYLEI